jgi:hypothetical protein
MTGTPEERLAKRRAQRVRQGQINQRAKFTADIWPVTLDRFTALREKHGLSADVLLTKLVRMGERMGV